MRTNVYAIGKGLFVLSLGSIPCAAITVKEGLSNETSPVWFYLQTDPPLQFSELGDAVAYYAEHNRRKTPHTSPELVKTAEAYFEAEYGGQALHSVRLAAYERLRPEIGRPLSDWVERAREVYVKELIVANAQLRREKMHTL